MSILNMLIIIFFDNILYVLSIHLQFCFDLHIYSLIRFTDVVIPSL